MPSDSASRKTFFVVDAFGVLDGRNDGDANQNDNRHNAAHITKQIVAVADSDVLLSEKNKVADTYDDTKFRRAHHAVRQFEDSQRVSREIDFDVHQEVGNEESHRNGGRHISRQPESGDDKRDPKGVHDVIDVEAVPRTLSVANSGQGAIETVAKPVDRETHDSRYQK